MFAEESPQGDGQVALALMEIMKKHRGLCPSSILVLIAVYEEPLTPKSQHQMWKHTGLSRPSITKATKDLVARGLIDYTKERLRPVNIIKDL